MALTDAEDLAAPPAQAGRAARLRARARDWLDSDHGAAQPHGRHWPSPSASPAPGVTFLSQIAAGALDGRFRFRHLCRRSGPGCCWPATSSIWAAARSRSATFRNTSHHNQLDRAARLPDRQPLDHLRFGHRVRAAWRGDRACLRSGRGSIRTWCVPFYLACVRCRSSRVSLMLRRRWRAPTTGSCVGARCRILCCVRSCCSRLMALGLMRRGISDRCHDHHDRARRWRSGARRSCQLFWCLTAAQGRLVATGGPRAIRGAGAGSRPRCRSSWCGRSTPCSCYAGLARAATVPAAEEVGVLLRGRRRR